METGLVVAVSIVLRLAVGFSPYSGENDPPGFGDFEAQRHWMEVTRGLPRAEWYRYDVDYWGIDYPPLSAFHAFLTSFVVELVDPLAIKLDESRGYETNASRAAMRASVLLWDLVVLVPAAVWFTSLLFPKHRAKRLRTLWMMINAPALLLIDHGHFQYNGVSLGLFVCAISCVFQGWDELGAVCFALSVNFKHLLLYFAPSLGAYALGRSKSRGIAYLVRMAAALVGTTALLWVWFDVKLLLSRIFPLRRGLFEDKVANVWCSISPVIKLKVLLDNQTLFKIAAVCTITAILPSTLALVRDPAPRRLLYSVAASSLGCYLLAFQVHEKQILIPEMAVSMLSADNPTLALAFSIFACESMFPLLEREGASVAYFSVIAMHIWISYTLPTDSSASNFGSVMAISCVSSVLLHLASAFGPVFEGLPDIYTLLFTCTSCAVFVVVFLAINYRTLLSDLEEGETKPIQTTKMD